MTPFNIYPMLDVIKNLELKPTFIDINLEDFGPNYSELESSLSRKPYCFFLTYLFGYVPNMEYILNLCKKYDVILIEDISHSIGSKYKNQYFQFSKLSKLRFLRNEIFFIINIYHMYFRIFC